MINKAQSGIMSVLRWLGYAIAVLIVLAILAVLFGFFQAKPSQTNRQTQPEQPPVSVAKVDPHVAQVQNEATITAIVIDTTQKQLAATATAQAIAQEQHVTAAFNQATVTAVQVQQTRDQAALAREQADAPFWQSFGRNLIYIIAVLTVLLVAVIGIMWIMRQSAERQIDSENEYHRREIEMMQAVATINTLNPDSQGNYQARLTPTGYIMPPSGNILRPVPQTWTFSPHYQIREMTTPGQSVEQQLATAETALLETGALTAPSFSELLATNLLGAGQKFILGYNEGEPVFGSWLDLYSSAIGGKSGMGKTTTVRCLVLQAVMNGAKLIPIDPHAHVADESLAETLAPLQSAFLFRAAVENEEILAALDVAYREVEKRLHDKTAPRYPLLVCVDELTGLMRTEVAKPLSNLLQKVSQEGRKVGVYALCMGQIWKGSTSGGTELRDSFASAYVHRMSRNQARMLLPTDEAANAERLAPGQAILYKTNGDLLMVTMPLTTGDDVVKVAGLIETEYKRESNRVEAAQEVVTAAPPSQRTVLSADESRIVSLWRDGLDIGPIVKELYGDLKGSNYQQRAREVQSVIRRAGE
jgi:flagellar basal body-associated protein FliL